MTNLPDLIYASVLIIGMLVTFKRAITGPQRKFAMLACALCLMAIAIALAEGDWTSFAKLLMSIALAVMGLMYATSIPHEMKLLRGSWKRLLEVWKK